MVVVVVVVIVEEVEVEQYSAQCIIIANLDRMYAHTYIQWHPPLVAAGAGKNVLPQLCYTFCHAMPCHTSSRSSSAWLGRATIYA